jgi:glycosyltransferase involved in cell wall biosynthesis
MSNKPLLSIVIPTKNRYNYLENLLSSLLENPHKNFEIIVSDNSDNNSEFLAFIDNYQHDNRLNYFYYSGWLSVVDNCNLGVERASGEFVCMLGDDDGILIDNCLSLCLFLLNNSLDAALVNVIPYSWPDITHAIWGSALSGKFENKTYTYKAFKLTTEKELKKVCNEGGAFGLGKLPKIYQGLISRRKLCELKKETNTYFPGPSPDMGNAVGISKYINQYVYVDIPCIISGQSYKSTGGQGSRKKHHGDIDEQKFLPKNTKQEWTKEIPLFWAGPTIYSESASKALIKTKNYNFSLNYLYLYACCLIYEKNYTSTVIEKMYERKTFFQKVGISVRVFGFVSFIIVKRSINYIKNIYKYKISNKKFTKSNDIKETILILNSKYQNISIELK